MIRGRIGAILAVIVLFGTVIIHSGFTQAQTPGSSLTTSPVAVDLAVHPGTSGSTTLEVMNNGVEPVKIRAQVTTFKTYGTNGQASISAEPSNSPEINWVSLSQDTFTAQPAIWTPIKFTISLPSSASLGYYYAVLFEPELPFPINSGKPNIVRGYNAILVLVDTHSSNEKIQLKVTNFSVAHGLYEYLPVKFSVDVRNEGNIFTAPSGDIYISQTPNFTHPLAILNLNQTGGNVLPSSNRIFQATWNNGFPAYQAKYLDSQPVLNHGQPVQELNWNFSKISDFRIGQYYAQLTLAYSNGIRDIPITSVVSFWVLPWKLLLIAIVLLAVLGFGLWSIGKIIFRIIRGFPRRRT